MDALAGPWVITGAASGFGRELAVRLAAQGAPIGLWDRDLAGLEETAAEIAAGHNAPATHVQVVDVTDVHSVRLAADESRAALGRIAHLASSAGVLRVGPARGMSAEDHALMIQVNYLGSVHVAQALLPDLEQSGGRAVLLFIASVAGLRGFPDLAGYSASKFAVVGYAQALRDELADTNVDVRVLCPPPGDTPMVRNLERLPGVYKLSRLYSAAEVVTATLRGLKRRDPLIFVDAPSRAVRALGLLAPRAVDFVIRQAGKL